MNRIFRTIEIIITIIMIIGIVIILVVMNNLQLHSAEQAIDSATRLSFIKRNDRVDQL